MGFSPNHLSYGYIVIEYKRRILSFMIGKVLIKEFQKRYVSLQAVIMNIRNQHFNSIQNGLAALILAVIICAFCGGNSKLYAAVHVPRMSDRRFEHELLEMVDDHDVGITRAKAAGNPFLSRRLILKSGDRTINPADYGAVDAIQDQRGHYIIQFESSAAAKQALKKLKKLDSTVYVEPDGYVFAAESQSSLFSAGEQTAADWGVSAIGADKYAWYLERIGTTGSVRVAVLDSGIRKTHEIFEGRLDLKDEYDYLDNDNDASDEYGHGTQVAGIIAQATSGLNGIRIVPVRVLNENGGSSFSVCSTAIRALAGKVDVMNLSFCMDDPLTDDQLSASSYLTESVGIAANAGTTVVISAGNSGGDAVNYAPANIPDERVAGCIIVGNSTKDGIPWSTSNYGSTVDVSAPGRLIHTSSKTSDSSYVTNTGTSFSAPYVSAAAAMLKLCNPSWPPVQIEAALESSARPFSSSTSHYYGSGIIDLTNLIPAEYLAQYQTEQENNAAAQAVIDQINALPETVGLSNKAAVEAARAAYDSLTADQKALVTNLNVLEAAETVIRKAEEERAANNGNTGNNTGNNTGSNTGSNTVRYPGTNPRRNVSYRVPLKKKQRTKALKVLGLAGGDKVVSWKSSDTKKVKIVSGKSDGTCVVRAGNKTGNARITAVCASGKKVLFHLRVQAKKVRTKKIQTEKTEIRLSAGERYKVRTTLYPITSTEKCTYKSGNRKIVAVTRKGEIRAVSPGKATVTVYSGRAKLRIKVIVR